MRPLFFLASCLVALGCSNPPPPGAPPPRALATISPAPSAPAPTASATATPPAASASTTPPTAPDSRVAPAAADAQAAGAPSARVLVPKTLPEGPGDPMQSLARAIDKEVAAAAKGAGASVVLYADTTTDYGCLCPPFVFAPFYNSGRADSYVLPVFARGVPDPPLSKVGLYRFFGHFDGRRITGFEWLKARGGKRSEGMSEYERKAPVFVVEGWCFEPQEDFGAHFKEEVYGPTLEKMAKEGRFCPGSKFPASVPE